MLEVYTTQEKSSYC